MANRNFLHAGMSRKEFSEHTGIPVRTLEDWEAARRTPPEKRMKLLHELAVQQMTTLNSLKMTIIRLRYCPDIEYYINSKAI